MKIGKIQTLDTDMVIEDIEIGYIIIPDEAYPEHAQACHEQNKQLLEEYKTRNNIS